MESIIVAVITGGLSLTGVIITNLNSNKKIEKSVENNIDTTFSKIESTLITQQAVTDTKIENLTREVREHNNFAKKIPVLEEQIKVLSERIEKVGG